MSELLDLNIFGSNLDIRKNVDLVEKHLLKAEQLDAPVYHHFSPGIYIREVHLSEGTFSIGHMQKTRHLNIVLSGRVTMINEDGTTSEVEAPHMYISDPGRKIGYIHENLVWLNVYPTDERDVEKLEGALIDKSTAWMNHNSHALERFADREDYKKTLEQYGFTEDEAKRQSINEEDQTPFPDGSYCVLVSDSDIHGKGLFATAAFGEGDTIAPARIDGKRTPAGRFTNHSMNPNAIMRKVGADIYLCALRDIGGCRGGSNGDEITVNYRDSLMVSMKERPSCQQ